MTVPAFFAAKRWAPSDDDTLKSLSASGLSLRSVAIQMNRSYLAVQNRAAKLKITFVKRSHSDHEFLAEGFIARFARREDAEIAWLGNPPISP
jgi:3-deoxy-D-manno-octulosonate 8-phosphate phosphatase KdsC-like HAD superfamily phosphatase